MALSAATQEVVYLKQLFEDLGIEIPIPVIYSDSQGCVQLAQNPCGHSRTKHIDIRHHFIQEKLEAKQIIVKHIPGERNPADGLTILEMKMRKWSVNSENSVYLAYMSVYGEYVFTSLNHA